ncbi:MAG: RNA polymerase sigma factor [Eubacteriales bacterium]|jgi:RNA polymerase sigma factor (sigma-70 family)
MRSEQEANRAVEQYADLVRRLCMIHLQNQADTADVFQTVFLKYVLHSGEFQSPEHEKAWFIRVTVNACRDWRRKWFRRHTVPLEEMEELPAVSTQEDREVLEAVRSLPPAYRDVIYLFYYEGYTAVQIGEILGKNVNTVYTLLARARQRLRQMLGGEEDA